MYGKEREERTGSQKISSTRTKGELVSRLSLDSEVLNSHPLKKDWRFPASFLETGSGWL